MSWKKIIAGLTMASTLALTVATSANADPFHFAHFEHVATDCFGSAQEVSIELMKNVGLVGKVATPEDLIGIPPHLWPLIKALQQSGGMYR